MVQNMTCTFWLSKMVQITHWGSGLVERQCQVQLDSLFDIFFSMEETTIGSGKKDEGDEERTVSDLRREVINAYLSCLKQRGLN